jgi:hypothetical protein|tara:strand:+ start:154 stop:483 length:330 start_codon:yes stop_codon:yes gene_type:complete
LSGATCIKDEMSVGDDVFDSVNRQCGRAVSNNSNDYWRCDSWLERPNVNNYKDNLDMVELEKFERDKETDKNNRAVQKFVDEPTGWGNGLSLDDIGLSDFIIDEISSDP